MRKSNLPYKRLYTCITITLTLLSTPSMGAQLGGTVYVPNLHAKCLSSHQECLLSCSAEKDTICNSSGINELAKDCALTCVKSYNRCESLLNKLRCIDTHVPIKPLPIDLNQFKFKNGENSYEN